MTPIIKIEMVQIKSLISKTRITRRYSKKSCSMNWSKHLMPSNVRKQCSFRNTNVWTQTFWIKLTFLFSIRIKTKIKTMMKPKRICKNHMVKKWWPKSLIKNLTTLKNRRSHKINPEIENIHLGYLEAEPIIRARAKTIQWRWSKLMISQKKQRKRVDLLPSQIRLLLFHRLLNMVRNLKMLLKARSSRLLSKWMKKKSHHLVDKTILPPKPQWNQLTNKEVLAEKAEDSQGTQMLHMLVTYQWISSITSSILWSPF